MYRIKPWEELTIQDDYMFKLIMSIKHICLNLLQEIYYESPRSQARRAQTDWVTFIKGGAQCPQSGRLCV